MKSKLLVLLAIIILAVSAAGCATDAQVASQNLSQDADQFLIVRRVVFYNVMHDSYILSVEGRCSIEVDSMDNQLELTCKKGEGLYVKHYLGLAETVTYFVEQLEISEVSAYRYKVIFKPEVIIPDIDLSTSLQ